MGKPEGHDAAVRQAGGSPSSPSAAGPARLLTRRALALIGALSLTGLAGPALAQENGAVVAEATSHPQTPPPTRPDSTTGLRPVGAVGLDSSEARAQARAAQRRFERLRERHLPRARFSFHRCDEIVGRFCLWHEPDEAWDPPPEPPSVSAGRDSLLEELARLGAAFPHDGWIRGQRVRYLREAERQGEALQVARDCRSAPLGGCAALVGYALHGAGDYRAADSAFAVALSERSAVERCRLADLRHLLDGRGRKAYRKLPCGARTGFEARFWWLADPLFLVPGNERRTEHYWRRVMGGLQEGAVSAYGTSWGEDLEEILIRYGWPAGWEKAWDRPGRLGPSGSVVAHDPPGSRHFAPQGRWIEEPERIAPREWELEPRRPRSHFAPAYAREFRRLEPLLSRFRRGDTAIVVAALEAAVFTPEGEPESRCPELEAGLFLSAGPERLAGEARTTSEERVSLVAKLPAAGSSILVSVEALCPAHELAARARFGARIPSGEPGISDLLIGRPATGDTLPATLLAAAERARASETLHSGELVPLYWEVYSPRGARRTSVTVELVRRGGGFFRRLASWAGLAGDRRPTAGLRWSDDRATPGVWSRAVALRIPEAAPPGNYTLRVTVELDGGLPLRTERSLKLRRAHAAN